MPAVNKQRKIAIVGSRSVGEQIPHTVCALAPALTVILSPLRQVVSHSTVLRRPFRRALLPNDRKHF